MQSKYTKGLCSQNYSLPLSQSLLREPSKRFFFLKARSAKFRQSASATSPLILEHNLDRTVVCETTTKLQHAQVLNASLSQTGNISLLTGWWHLVETFPRQHSHSTRQFLSLVSQACYEESQTAQRQLAWSSCQQACLV